MLFIVMLKVDNGGAALLGCTEIRQDPLFPDQVILMDVKALSWPFEGHWIKVKQWSVKRESVLNWMAGPLRDEFEISLGMLEGEDKKIPWPEGTVPNQSLGNHPEEIKALVTSDEEIESLIKSPPTS